MKIGCCAYSYRKHLTSGAMTMEDFIDLAAEEGFEGVELTNYYFDSSETAYLHSLKRRCLVNGLSVAGAAIRSEFTRASQEERAAQVDHGQGVDRPRGGAGRPGDACVRGQHPRGLRR